MCYCSDACLRKDKGFHDCSGTKQKVLAYAKSYELPSTGGVSASAATIPQAPRTYEFSERSMRGLTGLQNLGNSCYMNSGLQCILHTEKLAAYFLADRHFSDLNVTNPISTRGELATALGVLFKEMWMATSPRYAPWGFKSALGKHLCQFEGFNQHDVHEFLIFTLDLVHEDINRVRVKPLPREIETENIPEPALKAEFWCRHRERNNSVIIDLMHGLLRSESQCPQCSLQSLSFDPFLSLSVSLPHSRFQQFPAVFIPLDSSAVPVRLKVRLQPLATIGDVKIALSQYLQKPLATLCAALVRGDSVDKIPTDAHILSQDDHIRVFEVYEGQLPLFLNLFAKANEDPTKPVTSSRVLPIHLPASNREIYEAAYLAVNLLTKRESAGNFPGDFPQFQQSPGENFFFLRFFSHGEECVFCRSRTCRGCALSYTTAADAELVAAMLPPSSPLVLECVVSVRFVDCLKMVKEPNTDRSWDGSTSLSDTPLSLSDCFDATFSREQLDASNSVYCRRCQTHVQAFRKLSLSQTAETFIVHLKRFRHSQGRREKDTRKVDFPVKAMEVSQYFHEREVGLPPLLYDLYAVAYHSGELGFGHYTAACKLPNGEWWYFNDSQVTRMKPEDVVSESAYLLFYQLRQD